MRWTLGITAGLVVIFGLVAATFAVSFSGGWDEVLDPTHPQETDTGVVAARGAGIQRADAEFEHVLSLVMATVTGAEVVSEPPTRSTSICSVGQHNWKRDDPYDLACSELRSAQVAGEVAFFRSDMTALDQALISAGWVEREDASGLPGVLSSRAASSDPVLIEALPQAEYRSEDGRSSLVLAFSPPFAALDEDQYVVEVQLDHESFEA